MDVWQEVCSTLRSLKSYQRAGLGAIVLGRMAGGISEWRHVNGRWEKERGEWSEMTRSIKLAVGRSLSTSAEDGKIRAGRGLRGRERRAAGRRRRRSKFWLRHWRLGQAAPCR